MNKKYVKITMNFIAYLVLIGIIISLLIDKNFMMRKGINIIKQKSETEQITNLQKQLDELNTTQTEYANYIQTSKINLATAITNAGVTTSGDDTFETMISNVSNILYNITSKILYAKTNGSYTSESNETLYIIATTGGLWNSYYEPTVTGGKLTKINYLNNYHDSWSCNTGIYEWSDSKGFTINYSYPISTDAYPVTMIILK